MIENIYRNLVREAKQSPMLLSDIAGLETYISESYTNRSFIELLQNADDANSSSFLVEKFEQYLIVANDGRCFDEVDIESLCRSASSHKARGKTIGYRGIGFKSIVSIVREVHLISGEFEITFSKQLTSDLMPEVNNVPLIRIPHPLRLKVKECVCDKIEELRQSGYTTFFIFEGTNIEQIMSEYSMFEHISLLFLNNINKITININEMMVTNVLSSPQSESEQRNLKIVSANKSSEWLVYSDKEYGMAFKKEEGTIVRLSHDDAKIYAFLPTEDCSELGVIINADFSTDPSRRYLIYDDVTKKSIENISVLYAKIFLKNLSSDTEEAKSIIKAMLPYFDIRLIHLTNNIFAKSLASALHSAISSSISRTKLSPKWLNYNDYTILGTDAYSKQVAGWIYDLPGVTSLLKYFGCKEDDEVAILHKIKSTEISLKGYAQIVSHCIKSVLLNINIENFILEPIFISGSRRVSLYDIDKNHCKIDDCFLELLYECGVSYEEFRIFLKKMSLTTILDNQFKPKEYGFQCNVDNQNIAISDIENVMIENKSKGEHKHNKVQSSNIRELYYAINSGNAISCNSTPIIDIKKWRTAEGNVLQVLNNNGFSLKDVSKQNLGCDLTGIDPMGNEVFIEVKSLDYAGQKFRLTNNEYALAQYKRDYYYIALVISNIDSLEISLIKNPIETLNLYRQCTQWIWECSDYEYSPIRIDYKE